MQDALNKNGIEFKGNLENWTMNLTHNSIKGIISKNKNQVLYKTDKYTVSIPFSFRYCIKYFHKNDKVFYFTEKEAKPYFKSSYKNFRYPDLKNLIYTYDNHHFVDLEHWDGKQSLWLNNGVMIVRSGFSTNTTIIFHLPHSSETCISKNALVIDARGFYLSHDGEVLAGY